MYISIHVCIHTAELHGSFVRARPLPRRFGKGTCPIYIILCMYVFIRVNRMESIFCCF